MGSTVALVLLAVLFFTHAYHQVLAVAVMTFVLLGLMFAKQSAEHIIVSRFELNSQGLCSFGGNNYYQLQANSRFSFLGCWLVLQPLKAPSMAAVSSILNLKNTSKKSSFFIYRDSLSKQDFSRITQVINQLEHQS